MKARNTLNKLFDKFNIVSHHLPCRKMFKLKKIPHPNEFKKLKVGDKRSFFVQFIPSKKCSTKDRIVYNKGKLREKIISQLPEGNAVKQTIQHLTKDNLTLLYLNIYRMLKNEGIEKQTISEIQKNVDFIDLLSNLQIKTDLDELIISAPSLPPFETIATRTSLKRRRIKKNSEKFDVEESKTVEPLPESPVDQLKKGVDFMNSVLDDPFVFDYFGNILPSNSDELQIYMFDSLVLPDIW